MRQVGESVREREGREGKGGRRWEGEGKGRERGEVEESVLGV